MITTPYWIGDLWNGRFAILPRPRGGDWLKDEVRAWRVAGVDVVVSLLEEGEIAELHLKQESEVCRAVGLEYLHFPIPDRGVPGSTGGFWQLLQGLQLTLLTGKKVAVHCRQGVGRSALIAACLLVLDRVDPESAFAVVAKARGCPVPDTVEQRQWVAAFAGSVAAKLAQYAVGGSVDEPPPEQLGGCKVLHYALIDERCRPTGNCKQRVGGVLLGPAAALAICQCDDGTGYYLFGCKPDWTTVTDTWHETVEKAMEQAEFEYEGVSGCWQKLPISVHSEQ